LAFELKKSAKITLLSFNTTAVFLHDVMVSENYVLEAGWCIWCVFVSNCELDCRFELQWSESEPADRSREFRKRHSIVQRFTYHLRS